MKFVCHLLCKRARSHLIFIDWREQFYSRCALYNEAVFDVDSIISPQMIDTSTSAYVYVCM